VAKVEKLTTEQQAHLEAYFQDCLHKIGLNTARANFDVAEGVMTDFYARIGKKKPAFILCDSPFQAQVYMNLLQSVLKGGQLWGQLGDQLRGQLWDQLRGQLRDQLGDQLGGQLRDQLGGQLRDQLWDQLRGQLRGQLGGQLRDQLGGQLRDQLGGQLWDQLRDQLGDQLGGQLGGQLRDQLWDQLRDQLGGQLWDQLRDQLGDQLGGQLRGQRFNYFSTWMWGQWDMYWIAFYDFPDRFIHPMYTEPQRQLLHRWKQLAESVGFIYPFEGICFLCDRPRVIQRDDRNRLHCDDGPAMAFADGYAVWSIHGVRVPAEVVLHPEDLAVASIEQESNAEVRRVMIERFGQGRFLSEAGAKLLHQDATGKLWRKDLPDDEPMVMVEVLNSTPEPDGHTKTYFLRVHPELRPLLAAGLGEPQAPTAHNAVASTFGLCGHEYHPLIET